MLPLASEIRCLAEATRGKAEGMRDFLDGAPAPRELYRAVVSPLGGALPSRARSVIVPDGPLHDVNLEMLVPGGDDPRYWIEDVVLCVTPSLALLAQASSAITLRGSGLLSIGDPVPASDRFPRLAAVERDPQH